MRSAWSGIRPLALDPSAKGNTSNALRDHIVHVSEDNLITVTGKKLALLIIKDPEFRFILEIFLHILVSRMVCIGEQVAIGSVKLVVVRFCRNAGGCWCASVPFLHFTENKECKSRFCHRYYSAIPIATLSVLNLCGTLYREIDHSV